MVTSEYVELDNFRLFLLAKYILINTSLPKVGVHGIKIEFLYGRSTKTATFLPDVAKEQGNEEGNNWIVQLYRSNL